MNKAMIPENYNTDAELSHHLLCESRCSVCSKAADRLDQLSAMVTRVPQEDDRYYEHMMARVPKGKLWHTEDVVKIILSATYRNARDTADVEHIYRSLGIDFTSKWSQHEPVALHGSVADLLREHYDANKGGQ